MAAKECQYVHAPQILAMTKWTWILSWQSSKSLRSLDSTLSIANSQVIPFLWSFSLLIKAFIFVEALLFELKMKPKSKTIKTPNYTLVRKDRTTKKGGGVAFLVHQDLKFQDVIKGFFEQECFPVSVSFLL